MDTKALKQTIIYLAQRNSPCDKHGGCENRERCGREQLACLAFATFVVTGKNAHPFGQVPTRAMFNMVENSQGFRGQSRYNSELRAMRELAEQSGDDPVQAKKDWLHEINHIPYQGQHVTLNELAGLLGQPRMRLYKRFRAGWSPAEVIAGERAA